MNYPELSSIVKGPAARLFESAAGLVFPSNIYCICCGDVMTGKRIHGLCDECTKKIGWLARRIDGIDYEASAFENAYSVCSYDVYSEGIIYRLKLKSESYLADDMGRLMAETYMASDNFDPSRLVVPVPMHKDKIKDRGYNQAELLARAFAKYAGLSFCPALVKTKKTVSMRTARQAGRARALEGSIALSPGFDANGLFFVVIDDVLTTGATADACSRVLKAHGAKGVDFVSFAAVGEKSDIKFE